MSVNLDAWREEMDSVGEYLDSYGERLPVELKEQQLEIMAALQKAG